MIPVASVREPQIALAASVYPSAIRLVLIQPGCHSIDSRAVRLLLAIGWKCRRVTGG